MKILAISGSLREASSNSALLSAIQTCAADNLSIKLFTGIGILPIFNPDREGTDTPESVLAFCAEIDSADGILISCPEYVHAMPGGIKNAIDWLVSREEIMFKPVALAHASHRGDDMLESLRTVLATVTNRFAVDVFLRIPLNSTIQLTTEIILAEQQNVLQITEFLKNFTDYIESS